MRRGTLTLRLSCIHLGPEEHEPDHPEDQHSEPDRDCEESEHRRAGFSLACFGRGFDDLPILSRYHRALAPLGKTRGTLAGPCSVASDPTHHPGRCSGFGKPAAAGASQQSRIGEYVPPLPINRITRFLARLALKADVQMLSNWLSVAFRSIPWPPAPTGRASCAFRSCPVRLPSIRRPRIPK